MAATIILCFSLVLLTILAVNSLSAIKVEQQMSLDIAVDSAIKSLEIDKDYNTLNYEDMVNDILQLVIMQSDSRGDIVVKILEANTKEGLIDIEVTKKYKWGPTTKSVTTRRTVILEEYENPPSKIVTVKFTYINADGETITHREDETFVGALLRRPKNPKVAQKTFKGWTTTAGGTTPIADADWQNYIVPDMDEGATLTFYAIFEGGDAGG